MKYKGRQKSFRPEQHPKNKLKCKGLGSPYTNIPSQLREEL